MSYGATHCIVGRSRGELLNLARLLTDRAGKDPDAPGLHDWFRGRLRTTTFRGLAEAAAGVAGALAQRGVSKGDRVLVLQPMSLELYATILGALSIGAIIVVPDLSMNRASLDAALARFPCQAFVGSRRAHLLRLLIGSVRRIPVKVVTAGWLPWTRRFPRAAAGGAGPDDVPDEHPAVLTFTSGSTGRPKAALRTHGFLMAQERAIGDLAKTGSGDTDFAFLPLFVLANLARGVATVLPDADLRRPAWIDAERLLTQAREHHVTSAGGPPVALARLAEAAREQKQGVDSLRWIHTGGGPVFPHQFDLLASLGPNADIVAVYGSTEAEPIAELSRREFSQEDRLDVRHGKGLLVGRPVKSVRLAILRNRWGSPIGPFTAPSFREAQAKADEPGEIVVSGEHVLRGYVDPHDDTETKFRVDATVWHRTGDGGRLDWRGRLWLLGRCGARIEDARGELWPLTVEAAAREDPRVKNAALVPGVGHRILAVEGNDVGVDDLRRGLAWAHLDEIRVVKRIPMDRRHESKVDYTRLRRDLGGD